VGQRHMRRSNDLKDLIQTLVVWVILSATMSRKPASTKATGGGGFTFADKRMRKAQSY
jgi:hypothetical protein